MHSADSPYAVHSADSPYAVHSADSPYAVHSDFFSSKPPASELGFRDRTIPARWSWSLGQGSVELRSEVGLRPGEGCARLHCAWEVWTRGLPGQDARTHASLPCPARDGPLHLMPWGPSPHAMGPLTSWAPSPGLGEGCKDSHTRHSDSTVDPGPTYSGSRLQ